MADVLTTQWLGDESEEARAEDIVQSDADPKPGRLASIEMKVALDVDPRWYESPSDEDGLTHLERAVVLELARRLEAKHLRNSHIGAWLSTHMARVAKERVTAVLDAHLDEVLTETNTWGEPTGKRTTVRDMLRGGLKEYLARYVTVRGDDAGTQPREGTEQRLQWYVRQAIAAAVHGELKVTIDHVVQQVKTGIAGQATTLIARAVNQVLGAQVLPEAARPVLGK